MAIRLHPTEQTHILLPKATVRRLLTLPGAAARLYLSLALGDTPTNEQLGIPEEEFSAAESALIAAGLASFAPEEEKPPAPQIGEPSYTMEEAVSLKETDDSFSQIAMEAERVLGRPLSGSDLTLLMTIYSYFGLSAECMFLLINFTAQRAHFQTDGKRRPTLLTIKREALRWLENGIDTPERADAFIRLEHTLAKTMKKMEKVLGLPALSNSEKRHLRTFAELGFDEKVVALARDISQKRLGEINFPYMSRILKGWKKDNLQSAEEILRVEEERNRRQSFGSKTPKGERRLSQEELESIRQAQDYIRKQNG
ncbi:MAG TPA: hypothetical protein GX701_08565 [Clostridiales bacterium]|nr:hypothetical protein [Clostridiales bacterium]